jgi:hypothetical protein
MFTHYLEETCQNYDKKKLKAKFFNKSISNKQASRPAGPNKNAG